jgi:hypothetical protein
VQRKPLRTLDRFYRGIDVEIRPVEVIGSRPENVQDLADRCIGKPGELSKVDESSRPPRYSQKPCLEMLVTSTSPMLAPSLFNFDMSLFQNPKDLPA